MNRTDSLLLRWSAWLRWSDFWIAMTLLASISLPATARAGDRFDLRAWLRRPGVKVVALEFYATWCKPCMASVPRWKALHEKYRDDGLRLVVVKTLDPGGAVRQLGWNPDQRLDDMDGFMNRSFLVKGNLPAAFVWTWQGDLIVKAGHIDAAEEAIAAYLRRSPRVLVEAEDASGKADESLALRVRAELNMLGKFDVIAGQVQRKKLEALVKSSHRLGARQDQRCHIGMKISANSLLMARLLGRGGEQKLALSLNSAETGCLLASAWVTYSPKRADLAVREAVVALTDKLRREPEHPKGGRFGARRAGPRPRQLQEAKLGDAQESAEWDPSAGQRAEAVVKLRSNPAGAIVMVDGRLTCKSTPCSKAIEAGQHNIEMQLDTYLPRHEVVHVQRSQTLAWDLKPDFAVLSVKTEPPGLSVIVDGKLTSADALQGMKVAVGAHRVLINDRCYVKTGERVVIKRGESRALTLSPKPRPSAIRIRAKDERGNDLDATVIVDGISLPGNTPKVFRVPVCSQKLRVEYAGLAPHLQTLSLEEKKVKAVEVTLHKTIKMLGALGRASGDVAKITRGGGGSAASRQDKRDQCFDGDAKACNRWGIMLHKGQKGPKDRAGALSAFKKACAMDYAVSCGNVGNAYKNGWGTSQNKREARRWYRKGCDLSHPVSCNELGLLMHFGRGGLQDRRAALRFFERGCQLGGSVSCGNAGNAYKNGWGTLKSLREAGRWYIKGCDKSHPASCNELGIFYHFGQGYAKNRVRALELFKKACELGDRVSCGNVGNAYKNGWGVRMSRRQAKRYYKRACDKGLQSSCKSLKIL